MTEGDDIAEIVLGCFGHLPAHGPLRVGIDGRSAAGKTTFAYQLAEVAGRRGWSVVRASIDDFHPPGQKSRGYTPGPARWRPITTQPSSTGGSGHGC